MPQPVYTRLGNTGQREPLCVQACDQHQHLVMVQLAKMRRRTGLARQVDILALSGQLV